ncbi:hypothetical protein LCGC14_0966300 [marine sediment metagenome]|uniref:Uncharacterized protein n=1 Tax=marine sediment metagenome TaxID=412755 RepID=A0A0F9RJI5_9ZZZZ
MYALYRAKKIPKSFEKLIENNKSILVDPDNYKGLVSDTFKSNLEFYVPLILAIVYVGVGFSLGPLFEIASRTITVGTETIIITNEMFIVYIIGNIMIAVWLFIAALLIVSVLVMIVNTFRSLNILGEKNLKISYEDLKAGGFEAIGKFVISISIPTIVLSTFFSILGLYMILAVNDMVVGYSCLIVSLVITTMLSFLLYKNTTDIHDAISIFKEKLKHSLLKEIQDITNKKVKGAKEDTPIKQFARKLLFSKIKYKTIQSIHEYYDKIDEINDWPFNPKSIKKLVITLGSSLVPLALSFIGFG